MFYNKGKFNYTCIVFIKDEAYKLYVTKETYMTQFKTKPCFPLYKRLLGNSKHKYVVIFDDLLYLIFFD